MTELLIFADREEQKSESDESNNFAHLQRSPLVVNLVTHGFNPLGIPPELFAALKTAYSLPISSRSPPTAS